MRKYSASWGARLTFGLLGFGMLLFGIWMFATLMQRPFNSIGAQIFFLYFLVAIAIAPSLLFLYGFAETLATYNVSEEKITKWTLLGIHEIAWRNLSDFRTDKDNDYRLLDHRGNKIDVNLSLYGKARHKQVSVRLAVSGYYGCGNAGDEAVLAGIKTAIMRQAAQRGIRAELVALSQNPEETARLHDLPSAFRMSTKEVRRTLRESDLLLSGGGSLLQDTTSLKSLLYYLWVMRVAASVQTPFMFYAQGIGPLHRPVSRALVRVVANRAALLTVRDEPSAALLRQIGATKPPMEVTADPAFALDPAPFDDLDALFASERLPRDTPLVAVSLRPWHEPKSGAKQSQSSKNAESPVPLYARLLAELASQAGAQPVLLPMHIPDDAEFGAIVAAHPDAPKNLLAIQNAYPPRVLLSLVGQMQAVVALRLHTLIFAARSTVPPFALSYDPKVENLMQLLGLETQRANWRGFDPAEVAARVATLVREREHGVRALQSRIPELERLALRTADTALQIASTKL